MEEKTQSKAKQSIIFSPTTEIVPKLIINKPTHKSKSELEKQTPEKLAAQLEALASQLLINDKSQIFKGLSKLAVEGVLPESTKPENDEVPTQSTRGKQMAKKVIKYTYSKLEADRSAQVKVISKLRAGSFHKEYNVIRKRSGKASTLWELKYLDKAMASKSHMNKAAREEMYKMKWASSIMLKMGYDPNRIYDWGEPGSGLLPYGERQNFYDIRQKCLDRKILFCDDRFPANDASLVGNAKKKKYKVAFWKRPYEFCDKPRLFVRDLSRCGVRQGGVGDCWFLAALATITLYPTLLSQVIPLDQAFDEKYAGVFHFRFWQFGRWVNIVVDDRLPMRDSNRVTFTRSIEPNEFWAGLLEKAYAKLYGSYSAIESGSALESMSDLVGGLCETYSSDNFPKNLFDILYMSHKKNSVICAAIEADPNIVESAMKCGLVKGHSYSITKVDYLDKTKLVRFRNPWGKKEWTGPWSDHSSEWRSTSKKDIERLQYSAEDNGEFWMPFEEVLRYFDFIDICHVQPDVFAEDDEQKWHVSFFEGKWIKNVTAGGCMKFNTFCTNPQYLITLPGWQKSAIIVNVHQKNTRRGRHLGPCENSIGVALYYVPDSELGRKPLPKDFFSKRRFEGPVPHFENIRETTTRVNVKPGTYCIVACTFDPGKEGEFFIRVYTETKCRVVDDDDNLGPSSSKIAKRGNRWAGAASPDSRKKHAITPSKKHEEQAKLVEQSFSLKEVYGMFQEICDKDHEVDWMDVQKLLSFTLLKFPSLCHFTKEVCRSLIALNDRTRTGKMNMEEFTELCFDVHCWTVLKMLFVKFSNHKANAMGGIEFQQILEKIGLTVNPNVHGLLLYRYGHDGYLTFDNYILAICRLRMGIENFNGMSEGSETATINISKFIESILYS